MTTIVLGPRPPELEAFLERRRQLGQDRHDEVREGRYVVAPFAHSSHGIVQAEIAAALRAPARAGGLVVTVGFNLGVAEDFRVPDGGLHRTPHVGCGRYSSRTGKNAACGASRWRTAASNRAPARW